MKSLALATILTVMILGCAESVPSNSMKAALDLKEEVPGVGPSKAEVTASQPSPAKSIPRKIIYTGSIDLLVRDLSEAVSHLDELVKEYHGLVAQSEITSNPRAPRAGNWRVRIPVDRFAGFVNQVAKLGEPLKNRTDSEDITDKYFDFQVRIENKKVQVERLQKIIKEQTGKISEVLEAERELGRVTTELEELKGTVKLWENQTALATVNITLQERKPYVAREAPSFASSISSTFNASLESLVRFGEAVILIVVALTPWLPVIGVFVAVCWLVLRRVSRVPKPGT